MGECVWLNAMKEGKGNSGLENTILFLKKTFQKIDLKPIEVRNKSTLFHHRGSCEGSCRSWFNEPGIKPFPTCESPHLQAWHSRAERQGGLLLNSAAACPGACCVLLHLYELHTISRQRIPRSTGFPLAGCVLWHIFNWRDRCGS